MTPSNTFVSFIGVSCLLLSVGCGSDGTSGQGQLPSGAQPGAAGGQGVNPAASQLGCTTAPYCGSCSACYEACVCQTGNNVGCVGACSGQGTVMPIGGNNTGGSSGNAGTGAGGAANVGGSGQVGTAGAGTGAGGGAVQGAGGASAAGGAAGADWQEITLTTDTFPVDPGAEIYRAQNFANPIGHDVDIIESESFMTPGSHHMFAFHGTSYNANGGIVTSSGIEFAAYVHTAQTPQQITTYPAGIGRFLPAGDGIRLQVHYINTGTTALTASLSLRIRYVDTSKVQYHAAEVFLNNVGISVRPGTSTATSTVAMPYAIKLLGAASHMHKRAVNFDSKTNDGREIYTTTDWNEPKAAAFDPAMDIAAGGSITWACTWNNDTGQTLSFGESAATNEMCIFSGVYYPAPGGAGISRQCLAAGTCL